MTTIKKLTITFTFGFSCIVGTLFFVRAIQPNDNPTLRITQLETSFSLVDGHAIKYYVYPDSFDIDKFRLVCLDSTTPPMDTSTMQWTKEGMDKYIKFSMKKLPTPLAIVDMNTPYTTTAKVKVVQVVYKNGVADRLLSDYVVDPNKGSHCIVFDYPNMPDVSYIK